MTTQVAPYHLDLNASGELHDVNGRQFDPHAYSRMKYGVQSDLVAYAGLLVTELELVVPELFHEPKPPAILTSYKAVPPPATILARYCLDSINAVRVQKGLEPGGMVHARRQHDNFDEYAVKQAQERAHILLEPARTLHGTSIDGHVPVILDDIRVTGMYTASMEPLLGNTNYWVNAYLVICGDNLAAQPHTEDLINSTEIRGIADLLPFIKADDFVFTRRFLKMLLSTEPEKLSSILAELPDALIKESALGIVKTGVELQRKFPLAWAAISNELQQRSEA